MSYIITLQTRDQQQFEFPCTDGQTVQDAAEAAGFLLPAICKAGHCGTCLGRCQNGGFQLADYNPDALPEEAIQRHETLLCRTFPESDLQIQVPYEADRIQHRRNPVREAHIVQIQAIAGRTLELKVQLQEDLETGLGFEFEPGQYVELEIPGQGLKRAYSLANTPNWEGRLEFLIRLQENGQFSRFLQQAKAGTPLRVHGPSGTFALQTQSLNKRCFVAGGTGLAPFLSILRRMAEWGEDWPTHLIFGVTHEREMMCQNELAQLQQTLSQLTVQQCVWQPVASWTGFVGTPTQALQNYLEQEETQPDIYLCGPPLLVETATDVALQAGISEQQIYTERFI